ncbi:MAG: hypothetical protein WEF50_19365 [Myxococcota bacterium]
MSCTRSLVTALLLATACTIQRDYIGNEFRELPEGSVVVGQTTKGEILELLGPPDRILRQYDGDVFVYAYIRRNATTIAIEEPVITNLMIFTYQKSQEKSDRRVVFFDRGGRLSGLGFRRGTEQLERF